MNRVSGVLMRGVLTLVLLLVLAAPARADWTEPMAVSEVGKLSKGVQRIAGNARGDAIIAWERSDRAEFVARTAGGPFGKPWRCHRTPATQRSR